MRTAGLLIGAISIVGCASGDGVESVGVAPSGTLPAVTNEFDATAPETADDATVATVETDAGGGEDVPVDDILAELEANGFCDPADVEGTGDVGTTTAMQFVVDAVPAPPCFGDRDDRLDRAWSELAAVAPTEYLDDISLLAGYEACEGCDTLAFVSALDEAGSFFLMAIDVTAAQDDPDELSLTLLHELSHVFTQDPTTQLEVEVAPDACDTYHNGNGCLTDSSYLWTWMTRFWDPAVLDTFDEGEADPDGGEERCELGGEYTGSYGASSPEEDFAEVFAAYVFDVDFGGDLVDKLAFFGEFDEFRSIRERASEIGLAGLPNTFERCG